MRRLKYVVIRGIELIFNILSIFNFVIPKRENKIFFFNSTSTFQNNFALYNYLIDNNINNKYTISYYMPGVKKYIKNQRNVKLTSNLVTAVYYFATSKYVFYDTGFIRLKPSSNQLVMNLWHGVPFKSVGYMSKTIKNYTGKKKRPPFSKIIVPSETMKKIYMDSFFLNDNQIYYSGQPRNDLFNKESNPFELLGIDKKKYKKIIMWMTTYRVTKGKRAIHTEDVEWSNTNLPLINNLELVNHLSEELTKKNILLIIKHHTTGEKAKHEINDTQNIKILNEDIFIRKGLQLYEILGKCDALITDYSSVFIDYLLTNKPIGFIVDDIKNYQKINGFNVDNPLKFMPGHHINDLNDLSYFLEDVISRNDVFKNQRERVSSYFNAYNSKNNCNKILEDMGIKLS